MDIEEAANILTENLIKIPDFVSLGFVKKEKNDMIIVFVKNPLSQKFDFLRNGYWNGFKVEIREMNTPKPYYHKQTYLDNS